LAACTTTYRCTGRRYVCMRTAGEQHLEQKQHLRQRRRSRPPSAAVVACEESEVILAMPYRPSLGATVTMPTTRHKFTTRIQWITDVLVKSCFLESRYYRWWKIDGPPRYGRRFQRGKTERPRIGAFNELLAANSTKGGGSIAEG
jgi:hypothetical protein